MLLYFIVFIFIVIFFSIILAALNKNSSKHHAAFKSIRTGSHFVLISQKDNPWVEDDPFAQAIIIDVKYGWVKFKVCETEFNSSISDFLSKYYKVYW